MAYNHKEYMRKWRKTKEYKLCYENYKNTPNYIKKVRERSKYTNLTKEQKIKKSFRNKQYINRKRGARGSHTLGEWERLKAQYDWTCPSCERREPEIKLTEDHIISIKLGGSNNIENIQPLCQSCNSKKHTKTIKY